MTITAFPLTWPSQFPRAKHTERGTFKTALPAALKNVQYSLRLFAQKPADPGVAVWFTWDGMQLCIPVDPYQAVEANLQAIHHILEARRVELRHGTLALVRATFTGFKALPAPPGTNWWEVLCVSRDAGAQAIAAAYRTLAATHHPDRGGNPDQMAELNRARHEALAEIGGSA